MKIRCYTLFDITPTGIKSHYQKQSEIDWETWIKKRNQQRNWETLTQIFSLRTQPMRIKDPTEMIGDVSGLFTGYNGKHKIWVFSFEIETPDAYYSDGSDVGQLYKDADGVPMILGLDETADAPPVLEANTKRNIYFEVEEKDSE